MVVSTRPSANDRKEDTVKYFVLLAGDGEMPAWDTLTPEEQQAGMERHHAFGQACDDRDGVEILGGEALGDGSTATTMRTSLAGETVLTDGPFAEAAEHIGGFYVIEAPDLDTIIDLCKVLPPYDIEIRPVLDVG